MGKSIKGYLIMAVIIIAGAMIFKGLLKNPEIKNEKLTNSSKSQVLRNTKTKIIYFGEKFDKITYLNSGFTFYFDNATQPYRCSNGSIIVSGNKAEDASAGLGDSKKNLSLLFESSNGRKGSIEIHLISKK